MSDNDRTIYGKEKDSSLLGIFGIDTLELLAKKLSDATDFSFLIIDYRGQNITDGIICNDYCKLHMNQEGCEECQMTAAFAAAKAAIKLCPDLFTCPQGFYSVAVPIIVNEQYLGALIGGRVGCFEEGDSEEEEKKEVRDRMIPVLPRKKIEAIGDLMFLMLKEIGEKETSKRKLAVARRSDSLLSEIRKWNNTLQDELRESERKHLRARLHPQFMLDMIATISSFAVLEDAVKTEEITVDMASIIRYYLDESREMVLVEREMEQIRKYLSILRAKYDGKFNFHIQLDEAVGKVKIPVLILFPLLGYVLNYGAFSFSFQGTLFMDVVKEDAYCHVSIQLESRNKMQEMGSQPPAGIIDDRIVRDQLSDTARRLEYVYGDRCRLDLKTDMVSLRIPEAAAVMEVKM